MTKRVYRSISQILVLIVAVTVYAIAADKQRIQPAEDTSQEIIQLKLQFADQQRQIGELRASLQDLIDRNQQTASNGTEPATKVQRSSTAISQLGQVTSLAQPLLFQRQRQSRSHYLYQSLHRNLKLSHRPCNCTSVPPH